MINFTKDMEHVINNQKFVNLHIGTSFNTAFGIKLFINTSKRHHMYYFRLTKTENKIYYGHVKMDRMEESK